MLSLSPLRRGLMWSIVPLFALLSFAQAGIVAIGTDVGGQALVKVYDTPNPNPVRSFVAYPPAHTGGVRVAVGDVNGDGVSDVITVPGPGSGSEVRVFDSASGAPVITPFLAYGSATAYAGGVFVASADIDGDGTDDIITGTDEVPGVSARVKIFRANGAEIANFLPYGTGFHGGVRVAVGDVNGDGIPDIITGSGANVAHVKVFHGRTRTEIASFFAYSSPVFSDGVFVAAGDVNGDGFADIVTGAGPGAGPHVKVFSGVGLVQLRSFFAYEGSFNGGVRVAAGDVNGDGRADLITSPGAQRNALIKTFNGRTGGLVAQFLANEPTFTSGVFAGGISALPVRVVTNPATSVTETVATLNGTVLPNGRPVTVRFQYGTTAAYGTTVPAVPNAVSGTTNVIANLTGLKPAKTYHFRVVAIDALGGIVVGQDRTFSTDENDAPTGGTFAVTPTSADSGDVITATFASWTDPDGHTPLRYEVREGNTVIVVQTENATSQFILPAGTHLLTGRVYDALGAVTETGPVEVVVTGDPDSELRFVTRDPVPGAGVGGIEPDAIWSSFGVPAMADGSVKFLANTVSPTGKDGGVFSDGDPVALIGDPVPGAGAGGTFAIPTGAVFKKIKDPVTDAGGHVAFIATMTGGGVVAANDTVVVSNGRTGTLEVIAREGADAPGATGARFSAFTSISIAGTSVGGTIFSAKLAGSVGSSNNSGAWWLPAGSTSAILLARRGDPGFATGETIKSFTLHQTFPGTAGQGRGQVSANKALLRATLSTGKQALLLATPGLLSVLAETGDEVSSGNLWVSLGLPSSANTGQFLAVRGSTRAPTTSTSSRGGVGILRSADGGATWAIVGEVGDDAPGTDAIWIDLGFPVNSPTDAGLAFLGRVRGGTVGTSTDQGVWWQSGAGVLRLLAQEGKQAVGCAVGEKFKSFRSLAYPGAAGPIFVGTLAGSTVNASNDVGVWVVDSSGSLRLLFREGQKIGPRKIGSFTFLSALSGSLGVTRAFNSSGQVAWRAIFPDRNQGVVVTEIH